MSAESKNPNEIPPYAVLPELPLDEEARTDLTQEIWDLLITGQGDVDEFIDIYGDDYELTEDQLTAAHTALRDARLRQQKGDRRVHRPHDHRVRGTHRQRRRRPCRLLLLRQLRIG